MYIMPHTQFFLTEFDQCASSPCMHGCACASHPTGPVCILCLTLNNLLQSLTSVPPPLYARRGVCLPSNRTRVYIVPLTQQSLAEFDQCSSSPCIHGGVCASHPTGPVSCASHPTISCSLTSVPSPLVCMEVCASHPTGPVCILCLTLNNLLQSLTSVPPHLVCTEVCVPPSQQDLCVYCASHSTISCRV